MMSMLLASPLFGYIGTHYVRVEFFKEAGIRLITIGAA